MSSIFKDLAEEYPLLVDEKNRLSREIPLLHEILRTESCSRILDLGCATGAHSAALHKLGHEVRGIDINQEMIDVAVAAHHEPYGLSFATHSLEVEAASFVDHYDAILCLGNTFPQIARSSGLHESLGLVLRLLRLGGLFLGQLVNPAWIEHAEIRCLPVRDIAPTDCFGRRIFVRTYMQVGGEVILTVIRLEELVQGRWETNALRESMAKSSRAELEDAMNKVGFSKFAAYGGYNRAAFEETSSQSLVWLARK